MANPACRTIRNGSTLALVSPAFTFTVSYSGSLEAVSWQNHLTGRTVSLGGRAEVEIDLDDARDRIGIAGWRVNRQTSEPATPDHEEGLLKGFALPGFDDSAWEGSAAPVLAGENETPAGRDYRWARTHVFLPESAEGQQIALVVGGFGLFDFVYLRAFVNGAEVGTRRETRRWHAPGEFALGAGSAAAGHVRYGRDNVVALQLSGLVTRTARLDAVDPRKARWLVGKHYWPGQFEQYLVVGRPLRTPRLRVLAVDTIEEGERGEVACSLESVEDALSATVVYAWDAGEPVLTKRVRIQNRGTREARVMNVRLGEYATGERVSEGEQGHPVYIADQFFAAIAHPSGWVTGQDGVVSLRHYPAKLLESGASMESLEAVLGVAAAGGARDAFLRHVRGRMRRVVRGHDRAYAFFDCFGSWPSGDFWAVSQSILEGQIRDAVVPALRAGCDFDAFAIELWQDLKGDAERPNPMGFPQGLEPVSRELERVGIPTAFWVCTSLASWSIGANPVTSGCLTYDAAYGSGDIPWLCLATEPVTSLYRNAWRSLVRRFGTRLIKLDGTSAICYNPQHRHLGGVYSTEAIHEAYIGILRALDQECPELFIMHYWGPRSPWWLLHGDTLFESGLQIEARDPAAVPTLYLRDSVTLGLDQARCFAADVPCLGKDSLGIWLSRWEWNSGIGTERWQEGLVMDMCRGSLLAQIWSDDGSLSGAERSQLATFIGLLRARPDCFGSPRLVYGDPWRNEPYGWLCGNGERAFVAIFNCSWADRAFRLGLGTSWGWRDEGPRDLYRWYPEPARLGEVGDSCRGEVTVALRPFAVVLLEIVRSGERPTLGRPFVSEPIRASFGEPSVEVALEVRVDAVDAALPLEEGLAGAELAALPPRRGLRLSGVVPPSSTGGILAVLAEMSERGDAHLAEKVGRRLRLDARLGGIGASAVPILGPLSLPAPWQGWRIAVAPGSAVREVEALVSTRLPLDVDLTWKAYLLPGA